MTIPYKIFKNHIKFRNKSKIVKFFLKNETRYLIWLLSSTRFENNTVKNFNFYYKNIPLDISSQININNQIDLALEEGFLIKKKSDIDKRSMIITSSEQTKKDFFDFFNSFSEFFN